MDNQNFIDKRIRYIAWCFTKEEPWKKYKRNDFSYYMSNDLNSHIRNRKMRLDVPIWGTSFANGSIEFNYTISGDTATCNFNMTNASASFTPNITFSIK